MYAPEENGSFLHVSGMKYTIDTSIPSTVTLDDYGMMTSTGENRRVKDVQILQEDGTYAPIDPDATYSLASHNYMIKSGGCSVDYFMDNKLLQDEVMIDNQGLMNYITDHLGGVVGSEYANPYGQGRITIVDGTEQIPEDDKEQNPETNDAAVMNPAVVILVAMLLVAVMPKIKRT